MQTLLFIGLFAVLIFTSLLLARKFRLWRLSLGRPNAEEALTQFEGAFEGRVDPGIVRTAFSFFQQVSRAGFPVLPSDGITRIYGFVGEDVHHELGRLAKACGVVTPAPADALGVQTVAEAVELMEVLKARSAEAP